MLTTLVGIGATVAVGWYQLAEAERQAVLAEQERAKAVRSELVSIVEEYVLNNQSIDLIRLNRLSEQRRREERVTTPIAVSELLDKAEFNIQSSRYLAFDRKQSLKEVFDTAYSELATRAFTPYSDTTPNADLFNTLARQIQDGKSTDAIKTLKQIQQTYEQDLADARWAVRTPNLVEALGITFKDPWPLIPILVSYFAAMLWMMSRRPELFRTLRWLMRPRVSLELASERIKRYRSAGVPDDLIVERLWRAGFPRYYIIEELGKTETPTATGPSRTKTETAKTEPPPVA